MKINLEHAVSLKNTDTPFYTTYPPGGFWNNVDGSDSYKKVLTNKLRPNSINDICMYVHIPFCEKLCYYCFCYTKITNNNELIDKTCKAIISEIRLYKEFFQRNNIIPRIRQLQIGGGTPTYLDRQQFSSIISALKEISSFDNLDEFALEVDPRTVSTSDLEFYYDLGVNRISMGIQDFNTKVQEIINRVQPYEMVKELVDYHNNRFSINFDLIYGLPSQTKESFLDTLKQALTLNPDRLSVYAYDHTPSIYNHHKLMDKYEIQSMESRIQTFVETVEFLTQNGYDWIGVDHFAKRGDGLSRAKVSKNLGRTLNGYSIYRDYEFELGVGPSAISSLPGGYLHNIKDLNLYFESLSKNEFPVMRFWEHSSEDLIRKDIIMHLINYAELDFNAIQKKYSLDINQYFADELLRLGELQDDGLIIKNEEKITATDFGRIFIYHIAKVFDRYTTSKNFYERTHYVLKKMAK